MSNEPKRSTPEWAVHERLWKDGRFDISADAKMLKDMIRDLEQNAGLMKPWNHWDFDYEVYSQMGTKEMIYSWLGWGRLSVKETDADTAIKTCGSATYVQDLLRYIHAIDHIGIDERLAEMLCRPDCLAADLQSTIDTLLITAFHKKRGSGPIRIMEVGGGYGRLFETMRYMTELPMEYLLIDAVPNSIMFAYLYLKKHYPELRIGTPYMGDTYEPGKWDVYVMPSWETHLLPSELKFDVAINIDSFQEMNQHHVDTFIHLFDEKLRLGGLVYLSNSRDYCFEGEFNYPKKWECLYMHRSMRSWSRHHPTEIFVKTNEDASRANRVREAAYMTDLRLVEHIHPELTQAFGYTSPIIPNSPVKSTYRWNGTKEELLRHVNSF